MSVVIPAWLENLKIVLRTELPKESVESFMADLDISYVEFTDFNEAKNIWLGRILKEIVAPAATDYKVAAIVSFVEVGLQTDWVLEGSLDWARTASEKIAQYAATIYATAEEECKVEPVSPAHEKMLSLRHAKAVSDTYVADAAFIAANYGDDVGLIILTVGTLSGELTPEYSAACLRMGEMLLESLVAST